MTQFAVLWCALSAETMTAAAVYWQTRAFPNQIQSAQLTPNKVQKHLKDDQEKVQGACTKFQTSLIRVWILKPIQYFRFVLVIECVKNMFSLWYHGVFWRGILVQGCITKCKQHEPFLKARYKEFYDKSNSKLSVFTELSYRYNFIWQYTKEAKT